MTRPLRIEFDGAWYHVINRGVEKRKTFCHENHYQKFLSLLEEVTKVYGIEVHAFSLMPNHYHLLVHTPKAGLSMAMKHLNGVYTLYFNKVTERDGPLFKGRYKAIIVDSNEYLTELVRYIHQNPVKANLCKKAEDHAWTSHKFYLKEIKDHWLHTAEILQEYGNNKNTAKKRFDSWVKTTIDKTMLKEIENHKYAMIGRDCFKKWVNENFIEEKNFKDTGISKQEKEMKILAADTRIFNNLAFCCDTTVDRIKQSCSGRENDPRSLAIYILRYHKGYSLKKIAQVIAAKNENCVAQQLFRVKRKLSNDKKFRQWAKDVERAVLS
jgi:putative transposase